MKTIAIMNKKQGSGKTTIAVNLAHALTLDTQRVLLIDLDPSGIALKYLGIFRAPKVGLDQVLLAQEKITEHVIASRELLDLLAAGNALADVESMPGGLERGRLLKTALTEMNEDYDVVIIDCPAKPGIVLVNAIVAADQVIIPTSSDDDDIDSVLKFNNGIMKIESMRERPLMKRIIINNISERFLPNSLEQKLKENVGAIYKTFLHSSALIPDSQKVGRTIFEWRFDSKPAEEYTALANDFVLDQVI